ncbi:unnamed protein product [Ascophyllum nodosum]
MSTLVPVVNMADPAAPAVISKACKDHGFFYLENHGVPEEVVQDVLNQSKVFFELDTAAKMTVESGMKIRGYTSLGKEMVDKEGQSRGGTKEVFDIGNDLDLDSPGAAKTVRVNQWPTESLVPGWKANMKEYFSTMHALAERLTRLLAVSVGIDPKFFEGCFSESMCFLRLNRYTPEISNPGKGVFGVGKHTDWSMFTLLATDQVPGLQILIQGKWVDVHPRPGAFICNIGDMLQTWTNDHLRSTVHRVVNKVGCERYSIPFFVMPNFDTEVACLTQFCSEDDPAKYPPTTSGNYIREKFHQLRSNKAGNMK